MSGWGAFAEAVFGEGHRKSLTTDLRDSRFQKGPEKVDVMSELDL